MGCGALKILTLMIISQILSDRDKSIRNTGKERDWQNDESKVLSAGVVILSYKMRLFLFLTLLVIGLSKSEDAQVSRVVEDKRVLCLTFIYFESGEELIIYLESKQSLSVNEKKAI